MEDEGYDEGAATSQEQSLWPHSSLSLSSPSTRSSELIHALVAANHPHLVERGGAKLLWEALDYDAAFPEDWLAILRESDEVKRRDLAYLVRWRLIF